MRITVSSIPQDGIQLFLQEEPRIEGLHLAGPASLEVRVRRVGSKVILEGTVAAVCELQCVNCLVSFSKEITGDFTVEYAPQPPEAREGEHELSAAELDVSYYQGDEIDLGGLVSEQLLLVLPMHPLCSDSCKGLCPVCGENRNIRDCSCGEKKIDPRFSVLMKLKGEADGKPDE